jgi:hypothetical protein
VHFDPAGDGGHRLLDGEGNQALDVAGGQRGGHRVHHDLVVGDVGDGINRQLTERITAPGDECQRQQLDNEFVMDRKNISAG